VKRATLLLVAAGLLAVLGALARPGAAAPMGPARANVPCAMLDPTDVYLSEGRPNDSDAAANVPSVGKLRAAVLFVDFCDAPGSDDPSSILHGWIEPGVEWLHTASYGRLTITLEPTARWIRMPQTARFYRESGIVDDAEPHEKYVGDAIDAAARAGFDFSQTDVVYVVAPKTGPLSLSPTFRGTPGTFVKHGPKLGPAVTFGEDAYEFGGTIVPHETGHTLGLPDLYAFTGDRHRFVGTWDLMGNVFFTATDFFAWHRLKLGWLDPRQVVCVSSRHKKTVELAPIETPKNDDRSRSRKRLAKAVFVRTGSTTGLLVENRQRLGNDGSICDTGALVYTVDSSIKTGDGPITVIGGTTDDRRCGRLSDAPLHAGDRVTVGDVSVAVRPSHGPNLIVRVTARSGSRRRARRHPEPPPGSRPPDHALRRSGRAAGW